MANRLAQLLLRPARPTPVVPGPSPTALQGPAYEPIFLGSGMNTVDVESLLSPDLPAALGYIVSILQASSSTSPRLALMMATLLLNSPYTSTVPTSPASSSKNPTTTKRKPESARAAVALLFGISALMSRSNLREQDESYLEELSEELVGIFVKGGLRPGRSVDLDEHVATAVAGTGVACSSTTVWNASRGVAQKLDSWAASPSRKGDKKDINFERRRTRIRINTIYLLALFASSTSTARSTDSEAVRASSSRALFNSCVDLGLSIQLLGASPNTPSSDPRDAHASSLVWQARKRLELAGQTAVAVRGLPSDGCEYERWDGGAGERARLAEEAATKKRMVRSEEKDELRARGGLTRPAGEPVSIGRDLLDAPRRLKGKKIVHRRRGSYSRANTSGWSTPSSGGPPTPQEGYVTLRQAGVCSIAHHSHSSPPSSVSGTSTGLGARSQSTTSLPSLNKKKSIHLLHMSSSPSLRNGTLPLPSRILALPSGSNLKSETPIPLPTVLDSHGIFSPSFAPIEPVAPTIIETVYLTGSSRLATLRKSMSRLVIRAPLDAAGAPPMPAALTKAALASTCKVVPTTLPALVPTTAFSSEASTPVSSPTTPVRISHRDVPKLAFQPSSFMYECQHDDGPNQKRGGLWMPISPKGERMRGPGARVV